MKDILIKTKEINHPIKEVWKAISEGAIISQWFLKADFKAEVGYNYKFTHEDTTIEGKILEANPVNLLVYTWIVSGTDAVTTVSWSLVEENGKTVVTVKHTGITNYLGESAAVMFENFSNGWVNCLSNLNKFLTEAQ